MKNSQFLRLLSGEVNQTENRDPLKILQNNVAIVHSGGGRLWHRNEGSSLLIIHS